MKLLVDQGADLFALSEGDAPFAAARRAGHDHICDLLGPYLCYSKSAELKKNASSVAAVSGASEPWMQLRSMLLAKRLRMVPSADARSPPTGSYPPT